jgi:hypothetical protein
MRACTPFSSATTAAYSPSCATSSSERHPYQSPDTGGPGNSTRDRHTCDTTEFRQTITDVPDIGTTVWRGGTLVGPTVPGGETAGGRSAGVVALHLGTQDAGRFG